MSDRALSDPTLAADLTPEGCYDASGVSCIMVPSLVTNYLTQHIFDYVDDFSARVLRMLSRRWRDSWSDVFPLRSNPNLLTMYINACNAETDEEMIFYMRHAGIAKIPTLPLSLDGCPWNFPFEFFFPEGCKDFTFLAMDAYARMKSMRRFDALNRSFHCFSLDDVAVYAAFHGITRCAMHLRNHIDTDILLALPAVDQLDTFEALAYSRMEDYSKPAINFGAVKAGHPYVANMRIVSVIEAVLKPSCICDSFDRWTRIYELYLVFDQAHHHTPSERHLARISIFDSLLTYVPKLFFRISYELTMESVRQTLSNCTHITDGFEISAKLLLASRKAAVVDMLHLATDMRFAGKFRDTLYNPVFQTPNLGYYDNVHEEKMRCLNNVCAKNYRDLFESLDLFQQATVRANAFKI